MGTSEVIILTFILLYSASLVFTTLVGRGYIYDDAWRFFLLRIASRWDFPLAPQIPNYTSIVSPFFWYPLQMARFHHVHPYSFWMETKAAQVYDLCNMYVCTQFVNICTWPAFSLSTFALSPSWVLPLTFHSSLALGSTFSLGVSYDHLQTWDCYRVICNKPNPKRKLPNHQFSGV